MSETDDVVTLQLSDGSLFPIERTHALRCVFLASAMEHEDEGEEDEDGNTITLPLLDPGAASKLVECFRLWDACGGPPTQEPSDDVHCPHVYPEVWREWVERELVEDSSCAARNPELTNVLIAADYLQCLPLVDLVVWRLGRFFETASVEETRRQIGIETPLSVSEREEANRVLASEGWFRDSSEDVLRSLKKIWGETA